MARNMRHAFGKKRDDLQTEHDRLLEKSRAAVLVRRVSLPKPEFADDLPIVAECWSLALGGSGANSTPQRRYCWIEAPG